MGIWEFFGFWSFIFLSPNVHGLDENGSVEDIIERILDDHIGGLWLLDMLI